MFARMKTRVKIRAGFAAALVVATTIGAASWLASAEIVRQLQTVTTSQFPVFRALATIDSGFRTANKFLSNMALSRVNGATLKAGDCAGCHAGGSMFVDRAAEAIATVEKGIADVAALPRTESTSKLWPSTRSSLEEWAKRAKAFHAIVAERDRLVEAGKAAQADAMEPSIWAQWEGIHHMAGDMGDTIAKLTEALRAEAEASQAAGVLTQRRQLQLQGGVFALGALLVIVIGFYLGRSIDRAISGLVAESAKLTGGATTGQLSVRADEEVVAAEFQPILRGMNRTMDAMVAPIRLSAEYVARIARGDLPPSISERSEGEFETLQQNLNTCIDSIKALIRDANQLSEAAIAGQLASRADTALHQGDFRKIVEGFNATLDALMRPVNDAAAVLQQLARRDLRARVTGDYRGDHARIKEALNATAEALHEAIAQVAEAASQVSSASSQIASSSQSVASGATEQAAALEETGASLESMAATAKHATDNAQQANGLAQRARGAAGDGGAAMEQMTGAMGRIKTSAEGTSQIIKDINEIAFQTNLLALNAAVEAARAGDAGRGFAVVAEEVRSLALRSKQAASKTEELIRESVKEAAQGEVTAKEVQDKLGEIASAVVKVSDIVAEIAASATEQAAGIEQVNRAMAQMNQVTQQNAASSEESSSAATELSGESERLAALVATFQTDGGSAAARAGTGPKPAPAQVVANVLAKRGNGRVNGANGHANGTNGKLSPAQVIPFEELDGFGEA